MFKFLVWHVLVVAASCELFAQESGYTVDYAKTYHNYQPRDYNFNYVVSDPHTGDHKSQWEVKEKGVVRGGYSLLEPDGTTRIVEYIADDDGFRAIVKKLGTAVHPQPIAVHPQVPVVPEAVPKLSHYNAYDGQVANYANIQAPPVLYRIEQNLGHQETVLPQALGTIEAVPRIENLGNVGAVPLLQGYGAFDRIEAGPLVQGQGLGGAEANLGRAETVPLSQGHGIERIETVPSIQGHNIDFSRIDGSQGIQANLGRFSEVPQGYNIGDLGQLEAVPLQGHNLGRADLSILQGNIDAGLSRVGAVPVQGQNVERIETVPVEGQGIGRIEAVPFQGYGLGRADLSILQGNINTGLGKVEAVPVQGQNFGRFESVPSQGHELGRADLSILRGNIDVNLGRVEAGPVQGQNLQGVEAVPIQGQGWGLLEAISAPQRQPLLQSQGEFHAARSEVPLDNNIGQGQAVPGLVPISPSYTTNIQYYGLTGNPDDDSQNRKDAKREVYHASYSQKVPKMLPAPSKRSKLSKKEFIIYYPDSESD